MKVELIIGITVAIVTLVIGLIGGLIKHMFNINSIKPFEKAEKLKPIYV